MNVVVKVTQNDETAIRLFSHSNHIQNGSHTHWSRRRRRRRMKNINIKFLFTMGKYLGKNICWKVSVCSLESLKTGKTSWIKYNKLCFVHRMKCLVKYFRDVIMIQRSIPTGKQASRKPLFYQNASIFLGNS